VIKLSIIIPTINPNNIINIYKNLISSISEKLNWELVVVGPSFLDNVFFADKYNVKFIRDFGCPSRCLQIASLICEGEFITWMPDDSIIHSDSYESSIDFFEKNLTDKDGMVVLYSEGENYSGSQDKNESYWIAYTHPDLRLTGINPTWKGAAVFLYKKSTFDMFGGLDCRFEHINFNAHDLAFRIQNDGGKIVCSPSKILSVKWNPDSNRQEYKPILYSYIHNDLPLIKNLYSNPNAASRKIYIDNWKNISSVWNRRFS